MGRFIDLTGKMFGRLTAVEPAGKEKNGCIIWLCHCECGNFKKVNSNSLIKGSTKSCRCLQKEIIENQFTKHKCLNTPEYKSWKAMKARCFNSKNPAFKNYGGRGITVCKRWANSFENFLIDMGTRPSREHSIDRIDNDGDYCLENCRWATRIEQNSNKRICRFITAFGKTLTLMGWSKELGIGYGTLQNRLNNKWGIIRTFITPTKKFGIAGSMKR